MNQPQIEIREVHAHLSNDEGRVLGLRVLGLADSRERRIGVELCVADPGDTSESRIEFAQLDFGARATARLVPPAALGWSEDLAHFSADHFTPADQRRPAYAWVAEFDLKRNPQLPALCVGVLPVPLHAQAEYVYDRESRSRARRSVPSLALKPAFAMGVLFVHGIGLQSKSETLSAWSAPLLHWINEWFGCASLRLAERAAPEDAASWLSKQVVRADWEAYDEDHSERYRLATDFARHTLAKTYEGDKAAMAAMASRTLSNMAQRPLTAHELAASQAFAQHIRSEGGAGAVGGMAELADARLLDGAAGAADPSTVELHVGALSPEGELERSSWLLAESHWAESFRAPPFLAFGRWCLLSAPVILVHYFAMIMEGRGRSFGRAVVSLLPLATVVMLVELAFIGLFLLAWIPWERLRTALLALQRALAGVVGDSYVFIEDPVQHRAIVDRVRRDLEWLSQRCRRVMVVAHSQGAAVAQGALDTFQERTPAQLAGLATLGAGVQTLQRVAELRNKPRVLIAGWLALAAVSLFWGAVVALLLGSALLPWAAAAVGSLLLLALAGLRAWNAHPGLPGTLPWGRQLCPWQDFYATHDPVPWGPLTSAAAGSGRYTPHEVANLGSLLADHTAYWRNPEQVVGPVARWIARAAGFVSLDQAVPQSDALLALGAAARRARVGWLRWARGVLGVCNLGLLVAQAGALNTLLSWAWQSSFKAGSEGLAPSFPGMAVVWQCLSIGVPALLYRTALSGCWEAWGASEWAQVQRAQAWARATGWVYSFATALCGTIALTLAIMLTTLAAGLLPPGWQGALAGAWVLASVGLGRALCAGHDARVVLAVP